MIEILRDLAALYAFAFITGLGVYQLIIPAFLRKRLLSVVLIPGIGLAQLAIVSGYCIDGEAPISHALVATTLIGAGTLLLTFIVTKRRSSRIRLWRRAIKKVNAARLVLSLAGAGVFVAVLLAVLSPTLHAGMATTPYRIGIDQVGYAEAAQYLVEGGTPSSVRARLLSELQTSNLRLAEQQNYKDVHYETYVDSEFLLKAKRWGYPGALASATLLLRSGHVYKLEFLLLIFGYALTLGIVFYFARSVMRLPQVFAYLVMLAVALNCNLLNVYYEGQYAQVFAGPYFLLVLAVYHRARSWERFADVGRATMFRAAATFMLLTAALFSAFNESLVLLLAMLVTCSLLDVVFYRRTNRIALLLAIVGFVGGALVVWPFSHAWITYSIANLSGLSRAGFWQPHWASLAEMLGFSDMYLAPSYSLQPRSHLNSSFNIIASSILACLFIRLVFRAKVLDRSFWLAPFLIVAAEYLKSHYIDDILNYPFMKLYTMFIPLLATITFAALYNFARRTGIVLRSLQYAVLAFVMLTGGAYIQRYVANSGFVTADMLSLYRWHGVRNFDNYAVLTHYDPSKVDIRQYMYVPLLSMHWLDEVESQKLVGPDFGKTVLLIVPATQVECRECIARYFAGRIKYEDSTQLLIDTGLPVEDFCDPTARRLRIDSLGYNSQKLWIESANRVGGMDAGSYRQCDYGYTAKLLNRAAHSE